MTDISSNAHTNAQGRRHTFFQHRECEFFPCHVFERLERFNCLFCFCPLYPLAEHCGGAFVYTADGVKDCSGCTIPHDRDNYSYIVSRVDDFYNH